MDDHRAGLLARVELGVAMKVFDGTYEQIDKSLEVHEASLGEGSDDWQLKDANMEARIVLGKAKSIGDEYAQLGLSADLRKESSRIDWRPRQRKKAWKKRPN